MNTSSKKKWFDTLYVINTINKHAYLVKLVNPITYQQYFTLSKLIHHAFIFFQLRNYRQTRCGLTDIRAIHILLDSPSLFSLIGECSIDFLLFKEFLTEIRRLSSISQKIIQLNIDIQECITHINFIEELVGSNRHYKTSSLRQIKSVYLKKIQTRQLSEIKYKSKISYTVTTDQDLLTVFYSKFIDKWQPIHYSDLLPYTAEMENPMNSSIDLDLNILTETAYDIDTELYKPQE